MKAILIKSHVYQRYDGSYMLHAFRWHCRICQRSGNARNYDWDYIVSLAKGHWERNHD